MVTRKLNELELCFYKLLLLKSDTLEGKVVDLAYLEKETMIKAPHLIEPLRYLFNNGIILFENEELSIRYIRDYQAERKKYEDKQNRIGLAIAIGAGSSHSRGEIYDPKKRADWKTYYADEYCDLGKELFEKLETEKKSHVKIDDKTFGASKPFQLVEPISYFKFQLVIDKAKLQVFLDNYLDLFARNQFSGGDKFSYAKQAIEIFTSIQKLVDAGYPRESLSIDIAQICPKNKVDIRPTDGQKIPSIRLYDFVETVLAMEKEGFFTVLDIKYQAELNRQFASSELLWTDPIKIKVALTKDFQLLSLKYLSPFDYQEYVDLQKRIKEAPQKRKDQEAKIVQERDPSEAVENKKVIVKSIQLNEGNCMLEINDGTDNISFRSKKGRKGLEKETKLFKILFHLWDFRRTLGKNNSVLLKGDWVSLSNLATQTGSNETATGTNIQRLRKKFESKNLPIEIEPNNAGKYRLTIRTN